MKKNQLYWSICLNSTFVILEIIGFIFAFGDLGFGTLIYYTQLSNLLGLFVVLIYLIYEIMQLRNGIKIPKFVKTLKYVATCVLTMTFLIVLFVLVPFSGYSFPFLMFASSMLYHHTLCPIIAIVTFLFLENYDKFTKRETLFALSPTFLYAFVFLLLNILKVTVGPYFFLEVYSQPWFMSIIWGIICLGIAFLIVWLLGLIKNKIINRGQ